MDPVEVLLTRSEKSKDNFCYRACSLLAAVVHQTSAATSSPSTGAIGSCVRLSAAKIKNFKYHTLALAPLALRIAP